MAESLLPDTDAIPKNTIEFGRYRGKWLVRRNTISGVVNRCHTENFTEADAVFEQWKEEMRIAARAARMSGF